MLSFKYGRWQIPKTFGMTHGRCRDKSPCNLCMCGDVVGCKSKKHVFQMNLMLTGFWILVRFGCRETEKRHPESKMYLLKQQVKLLPQWWGLVVFFLESLPPPKSHFFRNLVQFLAGRIFFVYGGSTPHQWAPGSPTQVEEQFTKLKARIIYPALFQLLPGLQSARRETEEELGLGDSFAATCHWIWQSQFKSERSKYQQQSQVRHLGIPTRGSWNKNRDHSFRNCEFSIPQKSQDFRN